VTHKFNNLGWVCILCFRKRFLKNVKVLKYRQLNESDNEIDATILKLGVRLTDTSPASFKVNVVWSHRFNIVKSNTNLGSLKIMERKLDRKLFNIIILKQNK